MRQFLYKTLVFLLPILLGLSAIEMMYRFVPNTYTRKKAIMDRKTDAEILIFGNSHAYYGLNPEFFDRPALNLANISQSLYFDRLIFDKSVAHFQNLEYIILCVDYFTLSKTDNTGEDTWRKFYYKAFMGLEVPVISSFETGNYFLSATRPIAKNLELSRKFLSQGTLSDCGPNGFGTAYLKENRLSGLAEIARQTAAKHEDHLMDFSQNISRIQAIAGKCAKRNIKVLILTMPVCKAYAGNVDAGKLKKIFKSCGALQSKNKNVRYLNLFSDSRFTDNDFYDADHLHSRGAEKCSEIVTAFLKSF